MEDFAVMTSNQSELVAAMLDREAIRDLVVKYWDAIWRGDISAVVDLFANEGTIVIRNGPLAGQAPVGREELLAFYTAGVRVMSPLPFAHNHVVELIDECSASGRVYVEVRHSQDCSWIAAVIYRDIYAKEDGCWKIYRREAELRNAA